MAFFIEIAYVPIGPTFLQTYAQSMPLPCHSHAHMTQIKIANVSNGNSHATLRSMQEHTHVLCPLRCKFADSNFLFDIDERGVGALLHVSSSMHAFSP